MKTSSGIGAVAIFDHFLARDFHPKVLISETLEGRKIFVAIKNRRFFDRIYFNQNMGELAIAPLPPEFHRL